MRSRVRGRIRVVDRRSGRAVTIDDLAGCDTNNYDETLARHEVMARHGLYPISVRAPSGIELEEEAKQYLADRLKEVR
jgi:hypothetical protein